MRRIVEQQRLLEGGRIRAIEKLLAPVLPSCFLASICSLLNITLMYYTLDTADSNVYRSSLLSPPTTFQDTRRSSLRSERTHNPPSTISKSIQKPSITAKITLEELDTLDSFRESI